MLCDVMCHVWFMDSKRKRCYSSDAVVIAPVHHAIHCVESFLTQAP